MHAVSENTPDLHDDRKRSQNVSLNKCKDTDDARERGPIYEPGNHY